MGGDGDAARGEQGGGEGRDGEEVAHAHAPQGGGASPAAGAASLIITGTGDGGRQGRAPFLNEGAAAGG